MYDDVDVMMMSWWCLYDVTDTSPWGPIWTSLRNRRSCYSLVREIPEISIDRCCQRSARASGCLTDPMLLRTRPKRKRVSCRKKNYVTNRAIVSLSRHSILAAMVLISDCAWDPKLTKIALQKSQLVCGPRVGCTTNQERPLICFSGYTHQLIPEQFLWHYSAVYLVNALSHLLGSH